MRGSRPILWKRPLQAHPEPETRTETLSPYIYMYIHTYMRLDLKLHWGSCFGILYVDTENVGESIFHNGQLENRNFHELPPGWALGSFQSCRHVGPQTLNSEHSAY